MTTQSGSLLSILVVDDNRDGADSLFEVLRICGYDAQVVYSASEALAAAARKMPDVLISDIGMPHLDGCEVAARITALDGRRPLMIAITGYSNLRERCTQSGFDHFFVKPADPNVILDLVKRVPHRAE